MIKLLRTIYTCIKNPLLFKQILIDPLNSFSGKILIGEGCTIKKSKIIGNIHICENVKLTKSNLIGAIEIGNSCLINEVDIYAEKHIKIGDYTSLWGPGISIFQKLNPITIGKFCSIARGVSIQEYNHNSKKITTYYIGKNIFKENWENENVSKGPIVIGNDVWIGSNAMILAGTKIGNGCIVASNAVTNKEYPDYSIIAGVPGKVIGYRFDDDMIEYLKKLKWWEWSISKIKENKDLFFNEL